MAVVGPLLVRGIGAMAILASLLTTIWLFIVGYRLLQMARAPAPYPLTPNRSAE